MLVKQNGKMVWYDLRPPSRPEPKNNYKSKQKTAPKPKSNEKHAPAEPKPKPYEEMLASLPKCTVDLGDLLSDEDIARVQAKLKRDAKVKAIQEKIKMMPGKIYFENDVKNIQTMCLIHSFEDRRSRRYGFQKRTEFDHCQ